MNQIFQTIETLDEMPVWHWTDVAEIVRGKLTCICKHESGEDWPVAELVDLACMTSYYGALKAVAAAIGARPNDLRQAVALWSLRQIEQAQRAKEA